MSIKTAVKDHFSYSPISRHLKNHFDYLHGFSGMKLVYQDENLLMRKFTVQDVDKCAKLFKEVFSAYPWYDNWVSLEQARTYLIELIENPVFDGYVAYSGLKLVAVCFGHKRSWWVGKEFFMDEFYVRNESQGNGIGTRMMDYIKKQLIEEEYTRLVLLTNRGIPAEEFYIKNGFYNNQDRTVMVKELERGI
ncbi:GNAT family N-acetyltransferase [Methanobacterium sp. MBAC-LM]|uniref:GNAT family N-acetyltransferase n=1 Tax=Methanobacterium sp. MBAC-LM TaxID=3412034 RepID=UPI003C72093D